MRGREREKGERERDSPEPNNQLIHNTFTSVLKKIFVQISHHYDSMAIKSWLKL